MGPVLEFGDRSIRHIYILTIWPHRRYCGSVVGLQTSCPPELFDWQCYQSESVLVA